MGRQVGEEAELRSREGRGTRRSSGPHRPDVRAELDRLRRQRAEVRPVREDLVHLGQQRAGPGDVGEPDVDTRELEPGLDRDGGESPREDRPETLRGRQLDASLFLISRSERGASRCRVHGPGGDEFVEVGVVHHGPSEPCVLVCGIPSPREVAINDRSANPSEAAFLPPIRSPTSEASANRASAASSSPRINVARPRYARAEARNGLLPAPPGPPAAQLRTSPRLLPATSWRAPSPPPI